MAAFFGHVIRFGFNNPCRKPDISDTVADDFAEQFPRKELRIAVEEAVGQGAGGELGVTLDMAFRVNTAKCDGIITTPTLITAEPQVFTVHFDHPPLTAVSRAASQL